MDRLLGALTLPLLPAWAVATAVHPRWRRDLRERWGLRVPPVQPGAVWVHAASVGEVTAAAALLPHLPRPVLLTTDTETGAARARTLREPGLAAGVRPVDHPWTLAPLWAEARPRAVVFVEDTFWPALAWRARRAGVPVIRAGAGARTRRAAPMLRWLWRPTDLVLARDDEAAAWLRAVQDAPVEITGDPKADAVVPEPVLAWPGPFVVGASTRDGDEARLLDAVDRLDPRPRVLLAPRHPERFDAALLDGRRWVRRTALLDSRVPDDVDVVLLDTVGELAGCLAGADAVFVGGTFDPAIGGHSPWEAAAAGVPIVAGPEVAGQGSAFADVGATLDPDLAEALRRARPSRRPRGGARAIGERVTEGLGPPAPEASPRPWARPLAIAFGVATRARNATWDLREPMVVGAPVLSIGSRNARSPGRTSTVRALVGALQARGHRVGVAVRGYRRLRSGRDVRTSWTTRSAHDLGDEGALLAQAGALVAAGPDRGAAARVLVDAGATVIVLDDGLQHRRLHRDLDVEVVDARFPEARGLLPMGEAREAPRPVDLVLVSHGGGLFSVPGHVLTRRPGPWCRPGAPEGPVAAFCGIGRPADFLASLDVPVGAFLPLRDHEVPDPDALVRFAAGRPLVCTGKDAVRLDEAFRERVWWRDVVVTLPEALLARLPP